MNSLSRVKILQLTVVGVVLVLLVRLFYLQVVDDSYKTRADNNALRYMVQFPPRGEVYDRNGRFLVQSKEAYDLMATPREVGPFDTAAMSRILGVPVEQIRKELDKASRFSRRRASVLFKQLPKEVKVRLDERNFPGFSLSTGPSALIQPRSRETCWVMSARWTTALSSAIPITAAAITSVAAG